jgi:hypothetical protein
MSDITDRERRILLAHKVFEAEKAIFAADRAVHAARVEVEKKRAAYRVAVAAATGVEEDNLQFSDSMACFGTKLIMHCVWDLRDVRWPLCVFCGSPRDGE